MADSSFASKKKSVTAFKGHFRRSAKAYAALLNVKPHPTQESLEKAYNRVQKQLDSLLSALDDAITLLDGIDSSDTGVDVDKEAKELNDCYDSLLAEQCEIERQYVEVKTSAASISVSTPTSHTVSGSQTSSSTRPNVRVTALEPPSWSGKKADFYTWQKKFIHIMDEAKISDELTQLCYLQNQNRLPLEYQTLITDCSSMSQVWSRLEERVPKETIKFEIISQFRCLKPLHPKKTPTDLRNFANEISLFCRRMEDIGLTKDNYSCIVLQDVYERLDFDTSSRYRSKMELRQEILAAAHSSTALSDFECDLDSL